MSGRLTFTFPTEIKVDNDRCTICQEEFNTGRKPEIPIALPGCGHVFGSVCISQWLHTAERNHGCPLCRGKLFGRLPESLIDVEDEDEQIAGDEEDDTFVRLTLTPIDEPFVLSDLTAEFREWLPFQDRRSVGNSPGLDSQGLQQLHVPNDDSRSLVNNEDRSVDDATAAALRYFLGDCPSTEAVIDVIRRRDIDSYQTAVEDIVDERRHLFDENPDRRPSYAKQARLVYDFVQTAFRLAAKWLREHPCHNDLHLRCLYTVLETSLMTRAADFRDCDIDRLTDLIKAGIFSSPRIEGSYASRMLISQHVPGDIDSLRNAEHEPRPYMAQWMSAMPLLASAVRQIAESERSTPFYINDIDCESLWNEYMEPIQPVVLDRTSQAAEPTPDPPPAAAVEPVVLPMASPTRREIESELNRATETELPRPQLSQDTAYTESDFPRPPQVVERTARAAESLL